jgi:hypothetical protein
VVVCSGILSSSSNRASSSSGISSSPLSVASGAVVLVVVTLGFDVVALLTGGVTDLETSPHHPEIRESVRVADPESTPRLPRLLSALGALPLTFDIFMVVVVVVVVVGAGCLGRVRKG